jgi:hypothetical protein
MPPRNSCGPHVELTSNNAVRITRCSCGTMHVTLLASGVTVRMSAEVFRGMADGIADAAERLDERTPIGDTGSTSIN